MLKIEGQTAGIDDDFTGWYLDNEKDVWFFSNGSPVARINTHGFCYVEKDMNEWVGDFAPFTRLTGRIIISND